jgi:hypothetical protein
MNAVTEEQTLPGVTTQEKAERWANRRNKKLAESAPLFAAMGALEEVVTLVTPTDLLRSQEAQTMKYLRLDVCQWVKALLYLQQAKEMGLDTVALWAYFCRTYPEGWQTSASHVADFWHNKLRKHFGTYPVGGMSLTRDGVRIGG